MHLAVCHFFFQPQPLSLNDIVPNVAMQQEIDQRLSTLVCDTIRQLSAVTSWSAPHVAAEIARLARALNGRTDLVAAVDGERELARRLSCYADSEICLLRDAWHVDDIALVTHLLEVCGWHSKAACLKTVRRPCFIETSPPTSPACTVLQPSHTVPSPVTSSANFHQSFSDMPTPKHQLRISGLPAGTDRCKLVEFFSNFQPNIVNIWVVNNTTSSTCYMTFLTESAAQAAQRYAHRRTMRGRKLQADMCCPGSTNVPMPRRVGLLESTNSHMMSSIPCMMSSNPHMMSSHPHMMSSPVDKPLCWMSCVCLGPLPHNNVSDYCTQLIAAMNSFSDGIVGLHRHRCHAYDIVFVEFCNDDLARRAVCSLDGVRVGDRPLHPQLTKRRCFFGNRQTLVRCNQLWCRASRLNGLFDSLPTTHRSALYVADVPLSPQTDVYFYCLSRVSAQSLLRYLRSRFAHLPDMPTQVNHESVDIISVATLAEVFDLVQHGSATSPTGHGSILLGARGHEQLCSHANNGNCAAARLCFQGDEVADKLPGKDCLVAERHDFALSEDSSDSRNFPEECGEKMHVAVQSDAHQESHRSNTMSAAASALLSTCNTDIEEGGVSHMAEQREVG